MLEIEGHDCLDFWGANALELTNLLMAQKGDPSNGGPLWATRLTDVDTYARLDLLKKSLQNARGLPLTESQPKAEPGTIPQSPALNRIKDLALWVRSGDPLNPPAGGLQGDALTPFHVHGGNPAWLNTLLDLGGSPVGNNDPLVIQRADDLLVQLKDALDM